MKIVNLIENTPGADGCDALHGLSFYVETAKHRILFDAGPSEATLDNAVRLGIDLGKVDVAVLSHGHYDHSGGLSAFARLNPSAAIYLQRRAGGEHYGYDGPGNGYRYIGILSDRALLPVSKRRKKRISRYAKWTRDVKQESLNAVSGRTAQSVQWLPAMP